MEKQPAKPIESVPGRPRWWQWPTILALDAPAVAVTWQGMLARVAGVTLQPYHFVLLGVSVWLAYSADRWIDGWKLSLASVRTQRHYYFLRWRWPAFIVWATIFVGAVVFAVRCLTLREWKASLGMFLMTTAYLLLFQFVHRKRFWSVPKELCVAVILTGGALVYPAALASVNLNRLLAPSVLFLLLCLANCLLIAEWEREVDQRHGQISFSLQFSRARFAASVMPWCVLVYGVGLALIQRGPVRFAGLCGVVSAVLSIFINVVEPRIGRERARLLIDVALLTPLLGVLF